MSFEFNEDNLVEQAAADIFNTIPYIYLTGITNRVERIYV